MVKQEDILEILTDEVNYHVVMVMKGIQLGSEPVWEVRSHIARMIIAQMVEDAVKNLTIHS